jgi:flagellar hook-associated protein 3 FlgL
MRISTSMMNSRAINSMLTAQEQLQKAQDQISSGKKVTRPSDDPVAAARIMQLQQRQASNTQYGSNINALKTRLSTADQLLTDADSIIQQVATLSVQANNGVMSKSDRQSIAEQLSELSKQLLAVANTQDSNGEYLFAGYSTTTQPFARNGSGDVAYAGDQGVRQLQVSTTQYMDDSNAGQEVFMAVRSGNGTYELSANAANTGSGVINGQIVNQAAWTGGSFTLGFTSATDWEVRDSGGALITSGANYKSGNAITFNGISVNVTGAPVTGDEFQIDTSTTKDIFSTIDDLITTLGSNTDTTAQQAQYQNALNALSIQVQQSESHVLDIRASIGARVASLESADSLRQDAADLITTSLSGLQDADYTEAVSRYSQMYTALQAAQQAFAKTSKLSLFDYL